MASDPAPAPGSERARRYRIEVRPSVEKALRKIPTRDARRIAAAIDELAFDPFPPGGRQLQGADDLQRIRVGDYRVVYQVEGRLLVVFIVRIAHRKDVYRDL